MAVSVSIINWSEGVVSVILEARAASSILMWRWGSRICSELSKEVSTSSLWKSASAGPMVVPGVWFHTRS